MQCILFGVVLAIAVLARAQVVRNDQSNGITIKTLYVPLRKGSASLPIPDFSKVKPLTTLNLPSLSVSEVKPLTTLNLQSFPIGADLQQASTQNQNFRPKGNAYESNVQPLQNVRSKHTNQPFKSELSNPFYPNTNFQQQQYNNGPQQSVENPASHQYQFYQPEPNYGSGHHAQNSVFQINDTAFQHQSNVMANVKFVSQDGHQNFAGGRVANIYNQVNLGQQTYAPENGVNRKPLTPDMVYVQHPVQAYNREKTTHPETAPPRDTESNFSGESPRYFQQMTSDTTPAQQAYTSPPVESSSYLPSPHLSYGIQNIPNTQHLDTGIRNTNPFQETRHVATNHQLQPPVNTYAVVHQRIPADNFGVQGNRANVQPEQSPYRQVNEARQASYINNEPSEYFRTSPNREHVPVQMASQNYFNTENPQNSLEHAQYTAKQYAPGSVDSYHHNGHQFPTSHVQLLVPQHSQTQHPSSEGQHFRQQLGPPSIGEIRNQDVRNSQPQNSAIQGPYPDPNSETFYPDNKQIYIAPPPDYGSQVHNHQQQSTSDQLFARFPSPAQANVPSGQIPFTIQSGQVGIHVSIPNKNFLQ